MSHPLYFSYFIFFTPYILKLLYFLSPLLLTTTLLLLALLLTVSPSLVQHKSNSGFSNFELGFLLSIYQTYLDRIESKFAQKDAEFGYFDVFEAYKNMLETSIFEPLELEIECQDYTFQVSSAEPTGKCSNQGNNSFNLLLKDSSDDNPSEIITQREKWPITEAKALDSFLQEKTESNISEEHNGANLLRDSAVIPEDSPVEIKNQKENLVNSEVKRLESFFQEKTEVEDKMCEKEKQEVKPLDTHFDKVKEKKEKEIPSMRSGSKVMGNSIFDAKVSPNWDEYDSKRRVNSQRLGSSFGSPNSYEDYNLVSFGSMRKEKEWRRTLACKLFEERHNVGGGGEGMDLLWETYEESNKSQMKNSLKKRGFKYNDEYDEEGKEEEEEEDDMGGKLCCLQALKLSTGKMNLGMGRPNLVKISKALKGIGWLQNVTKHGRKVYR